MAAASIVLVFGAESPQAAIDSGCQAVEKGASRKMEEQKDREKQRRLESYPESGSDADFVKECLGGIYQPTPFPRFPRVPGIEEAARELCRDLRRETGIGTLSSPFQGGLPRLDGTNTVRPWDGTLNEDIWDALRAY
jgi:hypothetical protein